MVIDMKKKSLLISVLSIVLVLCIGVSVIAFGNNIDWHFDADTKTLYIEGSGSMPDYDDQYSTQWKDIIHLVENVVIEEGVTSVGAYAFAGAHSLVSVAIPDSVDKIGAYSFASCSALESLTFGENITSIADLSFYYDGVFEKDNFLLNVKAGTYSLHYAINNHIPFYCDNTVCGEYDVNINAKGMLAYYPFTAPATGTYHFYSTGDEDTIGFIYNSSLTRIANNDDYGSDSNFRISCQLTKGQTYYMAARLYSASSKGTFSVTIEPDSSLAVNCDLNHDGWVNAKDFAIMTQTDSPLKSIFIYFLNQNVE